MVNKRTAKLWEEVLAVSGVVLSHQGGFSAAQKVSKMGSAVGSAENVKSVAALSLLLLIHYNPSILGYNSHLVSLQ